jgi:ribonuclease HI
VAERRVKLFFDGGCRPNPGPIEVAVVLRGQVYRRDDLGEGSHRDAEWLALIEALKLAQAAVERAELIGDALEVVRQANRALADGTAPHRHAARFLALAAMGPPPAYPLDQAPAEPGGHRAGRRPSALGSGHSRGLTAPAARIAPPAGTTG